MSNWLLDLFGPPDKIEPTKIQDIATSPHQKELANLANQWTQDPTSSARFQNQENIVREQTADQLFAQNLIAQRNREQTGGNVNQTNMQQQGFASKLFDQGRDALTGFADTLYDKGTNLLQNVAQMDTTVRSKMSDAYSNNVNNLNNWKAATAGNIMGIAGEGMGWLTGGAGKTGDMKGFGSLLQLSNFVSDGRLKKNVVPIGKTKLSNGKSVNIYKYIWKHNNKPGHGVIAQEVQKVNPDAVNKIKGILHVDYKML